MNNKISISLFEPGMTHMHRVGLAGLFMTLKALENDVKPIDGFNWSLSPTSVEMSWVNEPQKIFKEFLQRSISIENGLITFLAHKRSKMGDLDKLHLHESILNTFLQHGKTRETKKQNQRLVFEIDEKKVAKDYKYVTLLKKHQKVHNEIFDNKGNPKSKIKLKGWIFPGGVERHVGWSNTALTQDTGKYLCLLFTPVASLFFNLYHRGTDGKYDSRRGTALILPHITDMEKYHKYYNRFLKAPVERLYADGLGDAGLSALQILRAEEKMEELGINGCSIITFGTVGWSKQQKTRTGLLKLDDVQPEILDSFEIALRSLPNKIVVKRTKPTKKEPSPYDRFFVATSLARGKISDNIARGRDWFCGFFELMRSKEQAKIISYERGGLNKMVQEAKWRLDEDKKFVEAIHNALLHRYASIASQAKARGEAVRFDREYERIRTSLMRVKNRKTMRAELADLLSRGGLNKVLQTEWKDLLKIFDGDDWQRARDLALLALASYKGKGSEEIVEKIDEQL